MIPWGALSRRAHTHSDSMPLTLLWVCITAYLVRGKFPFVSSHPPQTSHRPKQRHSHFDPQVPLSFIAKHQNHMQHPESNEKTHMIGVYFHLTAVLTAVDSNPKKGQKKTFMNKSKHLNINNKSLGLNFIWPK